MMKDQRQQLPVGTVVNLVNESVNIAIIGQYPIVKNEVREGYFDFEGVILPIGFDAEHTVFFNKEDIERVIFLGYVDVDFQNFLNESDKFEKSTELKKLSIMEVIDTDEK